MKPLPSDNDLQGIFIKGHSYVENVLLDSSSGNNLPVENLGVATYHSTISKSAMEGIHFDAHWITIQNIRKIVVKLCCTNLKPCPSIHSGNTIEKGKNRYNRILTCSPKKRQGLLDKYSELRTARYTHKKNSQKGQTSHLQFLDQKMQQKQALRQ